jgi:hypothetical protein
MWPVWSTLRAKHATVYTVDSCVFRTHCVFRTQCVFRTHCVFGSHGAFHRHRGGLLDARHCWAPRGTVMTRGASPETTPHVVRLFCCQANDAAVVCTHCIQSAAVRYITATLRTRAGSFAAGIRLRQSIIKRSGPGPAFSNPQVIALHIHNQEDQDIGNLHFRSLGSTAGSHRSRSATAEKRCGL